ncbi:sulfonate ABC transporter substrate-binding protein, partial [Cronobacter turicensis]
MKKFTGRAWLGLTLMTAAGLAQAEGNISIAQQFGIGYLLLDVVRDQQLIEKEGKKDGLDIKVEWRTLSGATAMNEALLSG